MKKVLHIGFDDTDSLRGSCTTHLATLIIHEIFDQVSFLDFPNLIRLNPNIPYKTRGNGAVALRIEGEEKNLEYCKEIVIEKVKNLSEVDDENTNPGIAFVENEIPKEIVTHSQRAMWDIISIKEAEDFSSFPNVEIIKFKLGRGIIGALGAIGNPLKGDFTYEHLSYREPKNFGTKRLIDSESIYSADKETPLTFNNVDYEYNSIMILPRGADPVFTGIRGETVEEVRKAYSLIRPLEKLPMQMVFRTNQHTNQHFTEKFSIDKLKPYISAVVDAEVTSKPFYIEGSHLIFSIGDTTGKIDCAAYEPTKRFRGQLSKLLIGDKVTVFGGIRPAEKNHQMTINVERLKITELVKNTKLENPFCSNCHARLKSAGKNKGFKCPKCSTKYRELLPNEIEIPRELNLGEYLPPMIAQRHLTKPQVRENRDNTTTQKPIKDINSILADLVKN